MHSSSGS